MGAIVQESVIQNDVFEEQETLEYTDAVKATTVFYNKRKHPVKKSKVIAHIDIPVRTAVSEVIETFEETASDLDDNLFIEKCMIKITNTSMQKAVISLAETKFLKSKVIHPM